MGDRLSPRPRGKPWWVLVRFLSLVSVLLRMSEQVHLLTLEPGNPCSPRVPSLLWLPEHPSLPECHRKPLEATFRAGWKAARAERRTTLKAQLIAAGRAKRTERDAKLSGKRARKEKKATERARIEKVVLVTTYSALKKLAIPELQDQLKAFKLSGKTGFAVTQKDRTAYVTQLQALLFAEHGRNANDLKDGDSGCDGDGVVRKVRNRRVEREEEGAGSKKRKATRAICELNGYEWYADEKFEIERILDKKTEQYWVGKVSARPNTTPPTALPPPLLTANSSSVAAPAQGKNRHQKDYVFYHILWQGYPPEVATWEPEASIHDDFIDEYEARVEAEAELEAEEEAEEEEEGAGDA
jgi:hypothetical protein